MVWLSWILVFVVMVVCVGASAIVFSQGGYVVSL